MYEIPETDIQDYKQKWLEAERDLALMGIDFQPINCEPIDTCPTKATKTPNCLVTEFLK